MEEHEESKHGKIPVSLLRMGGIGIVYLLIYGLLLYGIITLCQRGYEYSYQNAVHQLTDKR